MKMDWNLILSGGAFAFTLVTAISTTMFFIISLITKPLKDDLDEVKEIMKVVKSDDELNRMMKLAIAEHKEQCLMEKKTIYKQLIIFLIPLLMFTTSCTSIGKKSWGSAGASDAFRIKTSIDPQSGTIAPEIVAGGGTHVMMFSLPRKEKEQYPIMVGYSSRQSLWSLFGGTKVGNISFLYISGSAETPQETVSILDKIKGIVNGKATNTVKNK